MLGTDEFAAWLRLLEAPKIGREGALFVFRVFKRMSYALIVKASDPIRRGDRFSQP